MPVALRQDNYDLQQTFTKRPGDRAEAYKPPAMVRYHDLRGMEAIWKEVGESDFPGGNPVRHDSTIIAISSALILASLRVDNDTDLVLFSDAEDEVVAGFAVEARQSEVGMGGGGGARPDGEHLDTNYRTCTYDIKEDVEEGTLAGDEELIVDEDAEEDWGKDTAVRAIDTKTEELELDEVELELEIDVLADLCLLVEPWMSFDNIKITNFAISNSLLDGTSASGEGVASDNQI
ncbi:uncharacterized protein RCO7_14292 [Rhynchosporium graminicola]|uniref:Uncharacterized protein n=1 Tax=Rhynchosporium graminicola TaxID=2792576 RepID=A0A1E1K773_9HELO|nr:uncharacterized protein RCO7_14292 [Rhynchosporium commune]